MYSYITGIVKEIETSYIVVDNHGIGYMIYTANPYQFHEEEEVKIYVYQQIREDENTLYGFKTKEEKDLFLQLIQVKGLGCKMALPMLATGSIDGIQDAIERENVLYLKKFPKIGDKVARQIILDLKGKLAASTSGQKTVDQFEELVEVLKGLGYKQPDIKRVLPQIDSSLTLEDQIKEAVGGANYLVKDGEIAVATTDDYYTSRASRTCVGITADGKVVLMVLDGRQEPFSTGGSAEEIAQIMLDAGCVTAINLDGGGSTTYAAKQEGENEISVVNRPSDGYERSVSSSLMVVSTAKSSTEFDHALVTTETDYMTSGASMAVSVLGVSESGNAADLPEGAKLTVSDETIATLKDGVLTGVSEGSVTVSLVLDGENLGSKTVQVVQPDGLNFTRDGMNAVYGSAIELPIEATYNGNSVTICPEDIAFELSTADAGTIEGFAFTGNEESGVRNVTVKASLAKDLSVGHAGFRRCRAEVGKVSLPRQEGEEERGDQRTSPELFMKNG